jgi:holo-[acyl-carrier protein] synthase
MIFGIGVDLVRISRIEAIIKRWQNRFIHRVFTTHEAGTCYQRASSASAFALRFAAKEAFSKALGLGMRKGVKWREIEVFNYEGGKPGIRLFGTCADICREKGISNVHLSLSDEGDYVVAVVVLEKSNGVEKGAKATC